MDTKSQSVGDRVYEDFEPEFQWQRDETAAALTVTLPGFRRDQLRVQVTSIPRVKVIGEQQISDNKWRRITKEFSIPFECDTNDVTAKFERGRLYIKFSIKPSSKPKEEEAKPSNEVSEQKETVPEDKTKKEEKEGERDNNNQEIKKKKKVTTSGVVEKIPSSPSEAITYNKNGENLGATTSSEGLIKRTKTRVLDYTISLKPSLESEDFKKPKNWVNFILLVLFVVVLAIYIKQAFSSFLGVISSKF